MARRDSSTVFGSGRPGCPAPPLDDDPLELLDLLQHAVFRHLEILEAQVRRRRAVDRGVDVYADVVGFGAEGGSAGGGGC